MELSSEINELSEILAEITSDMIEEIDILNLGRYHRECLYDFLVTVCTAIMGGIKYAYRGERDSEKRAGILKAIRFKVGLYGDRVSELEAEKYALHEMTGHEDITIQERFQLIRHAIGVTPQLSEIMAEIEELNLEKEVEKFFYSFLFDIATLVIKSAEKVYKAESDVEKCREILKPIILKVKMYEYAVSDLRAAQYQDSPL
jgi:hypothetical protein